MLVESYLPLLAVMFPLVAIVFRPFVEKHRYYHYTLIVSFVTFIIVMFMYPSIKAGNILNMSLDTGLGFNFVFRADMLGFFVGFLSILLWTLSSLYAIDYMSDSHAHGRYNIFSLLSLGGMMGVVFTGNLFTLYIFFELLSVASAILVFHEETPEAMKAGFKYLFLGIAGGLILLFGIIMTYEIAGTGDLTMIGIGLQGSKWLPFIFWSFIIGFGVKAGMFPMHIWLPSAHPVAPSPASALLSGVMIKAGAYGIFKTVYNIIGYTDLVRSHMGLIFPLLVLALITIFLGSACAITQTEIKKMLAYSSISQIGYVIMGIALLTPTGIVGGLLHIFAHAFMKGTLFMCAGAFIHKTGLRELEDLKGIGKRMPFTTVCFSICALSMIGLPPFIGFISKWFLAMGSLEAMRLGNYWPGIGLIALLTLLLSSLLNLVYYGPVVIGAWMHGNGESAHDSTPAKNDEADKIMLIPMLFLSVGVFIFGITPRIPLDFVRKISKIFFP
ncbi:MAG: complex I subunit 5 family protein [bacterium]